MGRLGKGVAAKVASVPDPLPADELARAAVILGSKVRARREQLKMSQEELGLRAGMDRKAVQNVEYGRSSTKRNGAYGPGNPKLDTIYTLARVLDLSVGYLVDPSVPVQDR